MSPSNLVVALVLIGAPLAALAASYTPSHGWDVYYNWQIPSSVSPKALWHLDGNFTVTLDPGLSTYYYWSLYTL